MSKKKGKCLLNRKAIREGDKCICYYCLKDFHVNDLTTKYSEELSCPFCKWQAVLPVPKVDKVTTYWISRLATNLYDY